MRNRQPKYDVDEVRAKGWLPTRTGGIVLTEMESLSAFTPWNMSLRSEKAYQ